MGILHGDLEPMHVLVDTRATFMNPGVYKLTNPYQHADHGENSDIYRTCLILRTVLKTTCRKLLKDAVVDACWTDRPRKLYDFVCFSGTLARTLARTIIA
jgi:hypothetical protein